MPFRSSAEQFYNRPEANEYELTEQEKRTIVEALETERRFEYYQDDEARKAICDAHEAIMSIGRRALPYLKERLVNDDLHDIFRLSKYADALAEKEDVELVADMTRQPQVIRNSDGSALGRFARTLHRLTREIRNENPEDEKLNVVANILSTISLNEIRNRSHVTDFAQTIALTGAPSAKTYLEAQERSDLLNYWSDHNALYYFNRHHFETWDEILAGRQDDDEYEYGFRHDPIGGERDFSSGARYYPKRTKISPEKLITVKRVLEITDKMLSSDFEPTALPATKLHLYNFLRNNPDPTEETLAGEIKKCERWSELEKESSEGSNALPTIGIEVEIPKKYLTPKMVAVLDELHIPNYEEINDNWEVNPDFSYSPWIQSRIIQELAVMGALPLEQIAGSQGKKIPQKKIITLHVNLGLPAGIGHGVMEAHRDDIHALNDTLNYAFTSVRRIERRRVDAYYPAASAEESKKYQRPALFENVEGYYSTPSRLELKASEFRDFPSFRMLVETQRVGAMMTSYIKKMENLSLSAVEQKLAALWPGFLEEVASQTLAYNLTPNAIEDDREDAIKALNTTDLRKTSREIFSRYAKKVGEIIEEQK